MSEELKCWVLLLVAVVAFAGGAWGKERAHERAVLIQAAADDWCHYDCAPFDRPTLYFCVRVNNHILVGSRKADWFWQYDSSRMFQFQGKQVLVRFNSSSIWIVRTDGKEIALRQDYRDDVFDDADCSDAVRGHWLRGLRNAPRPASVPTKAVLVPTGPHKYFWAKCAFEPSHNWDLCTAWDSKGVAYERTEAVNARDHRGVVEADLAIDPLRTTTEFQIHLSDGIVLEDWAKYRVNDVPSPDSVPPLPPRRPSQR